MFSFSLSLSLSLSLSAPYFSCPSLCPLGQACPYGLHVGPLAPGSILNHLAYLSFGSRCTGWFGNCLWLLGLWVDPGSPGGSSSPTDSGGTVCPLSSFVSLYAQVLSLSQLSCGPSGSVGPVANVFYVSLSSVSAQWPCWSIAFFSVCFGNHFLPVGWLLWVIVRPFGLDELLIAGPLFGVVIPPIPLLGPCSSYFIL